MAKSREKIERTTFSDLMTSVRIGRPEVQTDEKETKQKLNKIRHHIATRGSSAGANR